MLSKEITRQYNFKKHFEFKRISHVLLCHSQWRNCGGVSGAHAPLYSLKNRCLFWNFLSIFFQTSHLNIKFEVSLTFTKLFFAICYLAIEN